jgi:hypothetical protein
MPRPRYVIQRRFFLAPWPAAAAILAAAVGLSASSLAFIRGGYEIAGIVAAAIAGQLWHEIIDWVHCARLPVAPPQELPPGEQD